MRAAQRTMAITAGLVLGLSGCGGLPRTGERLDARAVTTALERRTQIHFAAEPPPTTAPGLPSLAATYHGASAGEKSC